MNIKRRLADIAERISGTRILRPEQVGVVYEEMHLKRFLNHFKVDCVFDVGANKGQYAEMLRNRAEYMGLIISFEPNPDLVRKLKDKAAKDKNWLVSPIALSSSVGPKTFNIMKDSQFSSFLPPKHDEYDKCTDLNTIRDSISVQTSTLKLEYLKYKEKLQFASPFLKMDTQGCDVDVVESAGEIIHEFVGLQSELSIKRLYEGSPYFYESLSYLQSKGFELSAFVPNNAGHFPHLIEIDCIMMRSSTLPNKSRMAVKRQSAI